MNKTELIASTVSTLMRVLGWTLRIRVHDPVGYWDPERTTPFIAAAWHNRILALPVAYSRHGRVGKKPIVVLTSASRDGGLLASVVSRFGIGAVRGSSSKRGAAAVLQLARVLAKGSDVIITPDGPRGPRYCLGPGMVFLAQKTGNPMIWVDVTFSSYWELKSWDRFRIPKPFSRVEISLRPLGTLEAEMSDEAFESERARIEEIMRAGEEPGRPKASKRDREKTAVRGPA